ncbi:glycerophosphodiester phosphodiesterase family protein [Salmonella enterica]|nr:glycerophosphodiester phosphodiesterase family protein [Salmonella enterica]ELH4156666.1 glycerophosphodiester phosphodiesterase family protein [Salmonella enterica]
MKKYITLGVVLSLITGGSYALEKGKKNINFFPPGGNIQNCQPWTFRYLQLEHAAKQKIITTARHRGDFDNHTPENSLGAFQNSYEKCRPSIETDVRLTKDGKAVLFHDLNVGKMTNPDYDPELDSGTNTPLKDLTLKELQELHLITIERDTTNWKVPTINEFLEQYISLDPGTLVFLEVKEPDAMPKVINAVRDYDDSHPDKKIRDRIIIKFNMALYPTPDKWIEASKLSGKDRISLMANPVISPYAADTINKGPEIPQPAQKYDTNAERAVYLWSTADFHTAPVVEVVLKDSSEFKRVTEKENAFGTYSVPVNINQDNATNGTLAKMATIVTTNDKALGVFVPIPDYNMWRAHLVQGYTVNNTFGDKEPIWIDTAFFNNNSSCCYALKDRLQSSIYAKEANDWRMNIDWQKGIGATVYTADDTDSIDTYFETGEGSRPAPGMNSVLSWILRYVTEPQGSIVSLLTWNGAPGSWPWTLEGKHVCMQVAPSDKWILEYQCNSAVPQAAGYNQYLTLRKSTLKNKMQIYDFHSGQCVSIPRDTDSWALKKNCTEEDTLNIVRYADNRYKNGYGNLYMTFKTHGGLWVGIYWGYAYAVSHTDALKDSWSQWKMDISL